MSRIPKKCKPLTTDQQKYIIDNYRFVLKSVCNIIGRNNKLDADCIQETLLQVIRYTPDFDPQRGFTFRTMMRKKIFGSVMNFLKQNTNKCSSFDILEKTGNRDKNSSQDKIRKEMRFHIDNGFYTDKASREKDHIFAEIVTQEVKNNMNVLDDREQLVMKHWFFDNITLQEIANTLCCSTEQVRLIRLSAINKVRECFKSKKILNFS